MGLGKDGVTHYSSPSGGEQRGALLGAASTERYWPAVPVPDEERGESATGKLRLRRGS